MADGFKPNIYPIIWWALAYGLAAGILLWLITILDNFITTLWFPVFLAGLIWGAWRNYKKQKDAFEATSGATPTPQSPVSEFKEAVADIAVASRELMQQEAESAAAETPAQQEEVPEEENSESSETPPAPPVPPSPPTT